MKILVQIPVPNLWAAKQALWETGKLRASWQVDADWGHWRSSESWALCDQETASFLAVGSDTIL